MSETASEMWVTAASVARGSQPARSTASFLGSCGHRGEKETFHQELFDLSSCELGPNGTSDELRPSTRDNDWKALDPDLEAGLPWPLDIPA